MNYLDDFLFAALCKALFDGQVRVFLDICDSICFPVSLEKTFWGTQLLTFLGLLIDTINKKVGIPLDNLEKGIENLIMSSTKETRKLHCIFSRS